MKRIVQMAILMCALLPAIGCGQQPGEVALSGLTAVVYNYSDEHIAFVRVGSELAGSGLDAVKPGDVTGGGRSCCMNLDSSAKTVRVEVEPSLSDSYIVEAAIEYPVTKYPHYSVVHVLPGRKIVVAVTANAPSPRADLLDARLQELGIKKEVAHPPHMMDSGPEHDIE